MTRTEQAQAICAKIKADIGGDIRYKKKRGFYIQYSYEEEAWNFICESVEENGKTRYTFNNYLSADTIRAILDFYEAER